MAWTALGLVLSFLSCASAERRFFDEVGRLEARVLVADSDWTACTSQAPGVGVEVAEPRNKIVQSLEVIRKAKKAGIAGRSLSPEVLPRLTGQVGAYQDAVAKGCADAKSR